MLTVSFIEEVKANGDTFYFTEVDGRYVDNSLSQKREAAYAIYQNIVANNGKYKKITILESTQVEDK